MSSNSTISPISIKKINTIFDQANYNSSKNDLSIQRNSVENLNFEDIMTIDIPFKNDQLLLASNYNIKKKNGNYSLSVIRKDGKVANYTLYDQGTGIGVSSYTNVDTQKHSPTINKLSEVELAKLKTYVYQFCKNNNLSEERLKILEALLNDSTFLTALNDFTIENGCGTYSLLTILNGYYGYNLTPQEFFTTFLIKYLHNEGETINEGFDEWVKIIVGKINKEKRSLERILEKDKEGKLERKLTKIDKFEINEDIKIYNKFKEEYYNLLSNYIPNIDKVKTKGPFNAIGMNRILNNLGKESTVILDYTKDTFTNKSANEILLKQQLKEGKPIILMVRKKKDADLKKFTDTNRIIVDDENDEIAKNASEKGYLALTNSYHFITIVGMDDDGNVTIADSRFLPSAGDKKYSHILKMKYDALIDFLQIPDEIENTNNKDKKQTNDISLTFNPGENRDSGILFVDYSDENLKG